MKKNVIPRDKKISNFYIKILENEHKIILEAETLEFIDMFFDLSGYREGKVLYYDAFYMLKKGYFPRKYIYFVLYFRFRRVFAKQNIQQLKGLESFFANTTLNSAVAGFCKNKPFDENYMQYYHPESLLKKIKRKLSLLFSKPKKKYR